MSRARMAIVEAAYIEAESTEAWANNVLDAARPLNQGIGLVLALARADEHGWEYPELWGGTTALREAFRASAKLIPPELTSRLLRPTGVTASMIVGEELRRFLPIVGRHGLVDCLGIQGPVDARTVFGLYICLSQVRRVPPEAAAQNALLGIHLGAARRAHMRAQDEAWIDPSGRVVDAVASARAGRDELSFRARAIDALLSRRARGDADALRLWKGLVAGRWSLIQRFERDGRRYWIARENAPAERRMFRLTKAESSVALLLAAGQTQKMIAYALGISEALVSRWAARATSKLGLRSRAELVELYNRLEARRS